MRDHQSVIIEEFNGLWARGDSDPCPLDHATECINHKFIESGFQTRDGIDVFLASSSSILKYYYYPDASAGDGYLVLKADNKIYHLTGAIGAFTSFQVSNAITGMTDFGFVSINGNAFISPSTNDNLSGISGEFVYVYDGAQTTMMRKAAGVAPTTADGALAAANSATSGNVEAGIHVFGVVYETSSGFLTQIGPTTLPTVTALGNKKVDLSNICVSGSSAVTKRLIVASKLINAATYTGNPRDYQLFFVPGGTINDNTTTTLTVNFYDSELISDASHLLDLLSEIPAGGGLGTYHNRLLVWDTATNINEVLVSYGGEPEAIDAITGLLLVPKEGIGITKCQEYRDILYVFKSIKTYAFNDNGDTPTSWSSAVIDQGLGCGKNGVASVGAYGGIDLEALIIINEQGVSLFNGIFHKPELSFKIKDFWRSINMSDIRTGKTAAYLDALNQVMYINIPSSSMILLADFSNGLSAEKIRWSQWTFGAAPATIGLFDKDNKLVMGMPTGLHYVKSAATSDTISGSSAVKIPNPTYTTALINSTQPDDENIFHFAGIRLRVNGSGNLRTSLLGFDDVDNTTLTTSVMSTSPGRESIILANLVTQRARLRMQTTAINENFKVNRAIIFSKPQWTSYPM